MAWPRWYNKSLIWTRSLIRCFCSVDEQLIKGLYWERDGFILIYKRLEQGAYQWPRSESEVKTLSATTIHVMEGLKFEQPKAHKTVTGLSMI